MDREFVEWLIDHYLLQTPMNFVGGECTSTEHKWADVVLFTKYTKRFTWRSCLSICYPANRITSTTVRLSFVLNFT